MFRPVSIIAIAVAGVHAGPSYAACRGGETTVLSCTARGGVKALDVCLAGPAIRYAFGPRGGAPELQLTESVAGIEHHPWPGIGRAIWEATVFRNAGHGYEVFLSVDRMAETPVPEGGVTVTRGAETLATIACDAGSATIGLWAISEAKEALGICWVPDEQGWGACN